MEGESSWVVNGIITISFVALIVPLAAGLVDQLDALVLVMLIMYVVYTSLSGEAINPPHHK